MYLRHAQAIEPLLFRISPEEELRVLKMNQNANSIASIGQEKRRCSVSKKEVGTRFAKKYEPEAHYCTRNALLGILCPRCEVGGQRVVCCQTHFQPPLPKPDRP